MIQKPKSNRVLLLYGTVFLMVLVPYLFWRGVWFGRPLTDAEIDGFLQDASKPRKIQHALVQISERINRGGADAVRHWYPQVERLSETSAPEVRAMAVWLMGQDNQYTPFHLRLSSLVLDSDPLVRQNAALALVRFGDFRGKSEILAMLRPYPLMAPQDGRLHFRVRDGTRVNPGTVVARVQADRNESVEVRSPIPGFFSSLRAQDGQRVRTGESIAVISPGEPQVWESLRALFLVGGQEDLPEVERFFTSEPQSERVRHQAMLTSKAIQDRSTRAGRSARVQ